MPNIRTRLLILLVFILAGVLLLFRDNLASPNPIPTNTPTLTPYQVAEQSVSSNAEWQAIGPAVQEFDGVEMVLVPAGCFMMGSTDEQIDYAASFGFEREWLDEQPVHEICFDAPFWIDRYEVTNEQYGSVGCSDWSSEPDQPRNCVDWFEARDFCEQRDARLPTEAEWEYAARGSDSLIYPWGNEWDPDRLNWGDTSPYKTFAVGSFPDGVSWVGAYDLSSNVWEWTSSIYMEYPYDVEDGREDEDRTDTRRVLRGGSWDGTSAGVRAANRGGVDPGIRIPDFGFRCARSYEF